MKKTIQTILLCGAMFLSLTTGCSNQNQETNRKTEEEYDKELVQCLESELGVYLVNETNDLIEIPLSEIKNSNTEKIAYYKGGYASNHPDNKYVIVFPKNGTYDSYVMKDFDKYFYEKFSIYQMSDISGVSIYIHNQGNDVDFKDIANKCITRKNNENGKSIPTETLDKINSTTKIVIKSNQKELGTINEKEKLTEILNAISSSKQYGEFCLADGYAFEFEMYDSNNKLIDIIYVWQDGNRLIPKSVNGCHYSVSNSIDLRKIIEEETDYVFYEIYDYSDYCAEALESIYEDDKYIYFLSCLKSNEVFIKFNLTNLTMTLKYALENNYISAEKVASEYPDILMKEKK